MLLGLPGGEHVETEEVAGWALASGHAWASSVGPCMGLKRWAMLAHAKPIWQAALDPKLGRAILNCKPGSSHMGLA